jgi:hypothetical protein
MSFYVSVDHILSHRTNIAFFFTEVADSRFFDSLDFPLVVLVLLPVLILFLDSTTYYKCESPSRYVTIDSDRKTYIMRYRKESQVATSETKHRL